MIPLRESRFWIFSFSRAGWDVARDYGIGVGEWINSSYLEVEHF